jgi:hypothetical protein
MPFPLAHPAAVLPLRRWSPQRLSFPALVAGSLVPDLGYIFERSDYTHTFYPGAFIFSFPVGLVLVLLFYAVRKPIVGAFPRRFRKVFQHLCAQPPSGPLIIVVSLFIGIGTHLILDSIAHENGYVAERTTFLQRTLFNIGPMEFTGSVVFYSVFTFLGVYWVGMAYWRWFENAAEGPRTSVWIRRAYTFVFAAGILCVASAARGDHRVIGNLGMAVGTTILMGVFLLGIARNLLLRLDPAPALDL